MSPWGKVAKKFALYPPKRMMEELGLMEGRAVRYQVAGGKLVVEPVLDRVELAPSGKKWAKITVEEFARGSERQQRELYG